MSLAELLLIAWTLFAAIWWAYALWLVRCRTLVEIQPSNLPFREPDEKQSITIFKPLVALRTPSPPDDLVCALESFIAQTDDDTMVLFGVEQQDMAAWQPIFDRWRKFHPQARFTVVCQPRPNTFRNPKGSWCHTLANQASGILWLWSDADMVAPPELMTQLRREWSAQNARLLTCPYVIRQVSSPAMWLEALFVNVEFYPGVLACRRWGHHQFAFGAAMLFAAKDFRQSLNWDELGASMAEDNLLGRRLVPVHISSVTLETLAAEAHWLDALLHYLRWQKTIRWCNPSGYAAQFLIMPVLGWLAAAACQPTIWWGWDGLGLAVLLETLVAARLCARLGCAWRGRDMVVLMGWSLLRAITWVICWLPWPVVFRSQRRIWWNLNQCREVKS